MLPQKNGTFPLPYRKQNRHKGLSLLPSKYHPVHQHSVETNLHLDPCGQQILRNMAFNSRMSPEKKVGWLWTTPLTPQTPLLFSHHPSRLSPQAAAPERSLLFPGLQTNVHLGNE